MHELPTIAEAFSTVIGEVKELFTTLSVLDAIIFIVVIYAIIKAVEKCSRIPDATRRPRPRPPVQGFPTQRQPPNQGKRPREIPFNH